MRVLRKPVVVLERALVALFSLLLLSTFAKAADEAGFPAVAVTRDRAILSSEIAGTLVRLPDGTGAQFKKGDVLIEFDCRLMKLNRDKIAHERDAAKKKFENAAHLGKMASAGQLTVDLAQIDWRRAETELESADLMVQRCSILAPFDGSVVRIQPQLHETIAAGQPIVEMAGIQRVEIEAAVPAAFAATLRVDQALTFRADAGGASVKVIITGLAPVIDPVSQLVNLRARIDDVSSRIIPGMTGIIGPFK